MTSPPDSRDRVRQTFDAIAGVYDAVGVDFFGPIAAGLVEALAPEQGDRVLDLGCGPGAFLLPAARRVSPGGIAHGVDLSPAMVARARQAAGVHGLDNVTVAVADAQQPDPMGEFDVIGSSLVLFFLPDPAAALVAWRDLLAQGGRLGLATFGPRDVTLAALDGLFEPHLPPAMLDARTSGAAGPFSSDSGMEELVGSAGYGRVSTVLMDLAVRFADVDQWVAFSQSVGQRAMWNAAPPQAHRAIRAAAQRLLATSPHTDGGYVVHQQVRYTLATRDG